MSRTKVIDGVIYVEENKGGCSTCCCQDGYLGPLCLKIKDNHCSKPWRIGKPIDLLAPAVYVKYRKGSFRIVQVHMSGAYSLVGPVGYNSLTTYDDDLKCSYKSKFDIMCIGYPKTPKPLDYYRDSDFEWIWERKEGREITIDGETIVISEESFEALKKQLI